MRLHPFINLPIIHLTASLLTYLCALTSSIAQTNHERDVSQAETLIDNQQIDEALNLYRHILRRYEQRSPAEVSEPELGKLHLRLAQVYLKRSQVESSGDVMLHLESYAALHFWRCSRVKGLDSLLRDDICGKEVMKRMAPLQVRGGYKELFVTHPEAFRGIIRPNMLLPKGQLILRVTPKRGPIIQKLLNIPQKSPLILESEASLTAQPPRLDQRNAAGLILRPQGTIEKVGSAPKKTLHTIPRMPGYVMAGLGTAGLLVAGLSHFDVIKPPAGRERTTKWSLISGVSLLALGGGWIAFTW